MVLIFDGAGTGWADAFEDSANRLHARYERLKQLGVTEEICDFCAGAFKVRESLKKKSEVPLVSEFEGHPSVKKWVDQGYEVVIL